MRIDSQVTGPFKKKWYLTFLLVRILNCKTTFPIIITLTFIISPRPLPLSACPRFHTGPYNLHCTECYFLRSGTMGDGAAPVAFWKLTFICFAASVDLIILAFLSKLHCVLSYSFDMCWRGRPWLCLQTVCFKFFLKYQIIKRGEEKISLKDSRQWSRGKGLNVRSPRNILKLIKTPALH